MPKATMNENAQPVAWQHQIRFSGKVLPVKPESETVAMQQTPDL